MNIIDIIQSENIHKKIINNIAEYYALISKSDYGLLFFYDIQTLEFHAVSMENSLDENLTENIKNIAIGMETNILITEKFLIKQCKMFGSINLVLYLYGKSEKYKETDICDDDIEIISNYFSYLFVSKVLTDKYTDQYKIVFDKSNEIIFFVQNENIMCMNKKFMSIIGYSEEEIYKKNISCIVHPDDIKNIMSVLLNMENQIIDDIMIKYITKTKDIAYISSKIVKSDSDLFIFMGRDMTANMNTEEDILKANVVNYLISQLSAIHGFCQITMLENEKVMPDNKIIDSNINTIYRTTIDTMAYLSSKVDNSEDEKKIISDGCTIGTIIEKSIECISNYVVNNKMDLYYNKSYENIICISDNKKLTQLIINIFYLLIGKTRGKNTKIKIDIECDMNNRFLCVIIKISKSDNNIELNMDDCNIELFTKMALALNCKVELSGNTFVLCVPLLLTTENLENINTSKRGEIMKIVSGKKYMVLYVENNQHNVELVRKILETYCNDASLFSAYQGYIGIDMITENKFDLILLDFYLSDIDGEHILKIIRKSEKNIYTPVYIISGETNIEIINRCVANGANGFLTKPLQINILRDILNNVLTK